MHADWNNPDRLLVALFLASVVHALAIFGIGFELPKPAKMRESLDIVLVRAPSLQAPEKADFLAPHHQRGSGEAKEIAVPAALPFPREGAGAAPLETRAKPPSQSRSMPALTTAQAEKSIRADRRAKEEESDAETEPARLAAEALSRQIAEFSDEYNRPLQNRARGPKVVYINRVNARKYNAAAYESAWRDKVERIGNLNYPDEARRKNLSGSLVLAVGIKQDGNIQSIKVTTSSGEAALDEAAKRIVRMAAPFAPFPEELKQEADVLVITRAWRFSNENRVQTGP
jgi:protein TonB